MSGVLFDEAKRLADRGWPVFPVAPMAKLPAISKEDGGRGHLDATTDETVIQAWWRLAPDRNVGVATGVANLVVLDVDPRNGGDESFRDLCDEYGVEWLNTVTVRTAGGGTHFYFLGDGRDLRSRTGLRHGIDIKAATGYVVAPPSRTGSGEYRWEAGRDPDSIDCLPVPHWLVSEIGTSSSRAKGAATRELPASIPSGERNDTLASTAGSMRARGLSASEMIPSLLEVNQRCSEPLPDSEVRAIAESVARYSPAPAPAPTPLFSHISLLSHADTEKEWPEPPGDAAFSGVAGHVVDTIQPHTEADRVALLANFLVAFGSALGTGPHFLVGATRHYAREYVALVGKTSKARKGDSWPPVYEVMRTAEASWSDRVLGGLSTGEGLIFTVRDAVEKKEPIKEKGRVVDYQMVISDEGVEDKRLLVVEPELAKVLKVMERQGNSLSPVLRQAWDHGTLRVMTRANPLTATDAHISLVGHITVEELSRLLPDVEAANGFMNRFLILAVRRGTLLPEPEPFSGEIVSRLAFHVQHALVEASVVGRMYRSPEARELWRDVYPEISAEKDGLAGALQARGEAHVLRLSMLYALLDGRAEIGADHLLAALEIWAYAERSVDHIFGDATGNPTADAILRALRTSGEMTRTDISALFGRHESGSAIDRALRELLTRGKVQMESRSTGGRPVEVWRAG